jgi:hypothetical protein
MRYRLIPVAGSNGYREGNVRDLSLEGLRFQCTGSLRPKAGLLLELIIPGDEPVRSFGRTTWVRELPGQAGFEVGGRFVDQSTAVRRAIGRQIGA